MRQILFNGNEKKLRQVLNKISKMRLHDLQAACIMRSLEFTDLGQFDIGMLSSWLIKNWDEKPDRELLEDYDIWMYNLLGDRGYPEDDPLRNFRKFSTMDEQDNPIVKTRALKKAEVPNKKKEKKERNSLGLFKGTKKDYTYELGKSLLEKYKEKYTNKEILKKFSMQLYNKVQSKFPEAKDKSVKIWMKRALDEYRKHD